MKTLSFEMMKSRMQSIQEQPKSKITNQRQELVKKFLDRLNESRDGEKYKPLSPARVAVKMSFMSVSELYQFYGYCDESSNFSSTWWYLLNPKNY